MKEKYLKIVMVILILINILSIIWRYVCWGIIQKYDIEALYIALDDVSEDKQRYGRYAIDFIFENIKWDNLINIGFLLVMLVVCVFMLRKNKA